MLLKVVVVVRHRIGNATFCKSCHCARLGRSEPDGRVLFGGIMLDRGINYLLIKIWLQSVFFVVPCGIESHNMVVVHPHEAKAESNPS